MREMFTESVILQSSNILKHNLSEGMYKPSIVSYMIINHLIYLGWAKIVKTNEMFKIAVRVWVSNHWLLDCLLDSWVRQSSIKFILLPFVRGIHCQ